MDLVFVVRAALRVDGVGVPTAVAWSPDGARLAFVNLPGRDAAEVWVGRPSGGDLRKVAEKSAPGRFEGVTWTPHGRSLVVGRIRFENEVACATPQAERSPPTRCALRLRCSWPPPRLGGLDDRRGLRLPRRPSP